MKDQMQYIVIEGRKPQDGAKPAQALLILPKWISPTLACAGIVGRVIELTDGNVIEQGAVFMGEQETLESLRIDISQDSESQQEPTGDFASSRAGAMEPIEAPPLPNVDPHAVDNAYRQGAQAERNSMLGAMSRAGMPPNTRPMDWINGVVSKLAETEALLQTTQTCLEAVQETEAAPITPDREFINRLCLEFGAQLGDTWQEWLREQLEELAQFRKDRPETLAKLQAAEAIVDEVRNAKIPVGSNERIAQLELIANNALRDMNNSNDEVCKLMMANEHMREELRNMHVQLLERPTVMNFAGPVTIVQGNPPSVFGPDLGKSAE